MLYKFLENGKTNTIWRDFDRLNEALTRSFLDQDSVRPNSYPPLNVYTKEDDAFVYAFLPGMTIEDIDLSAKDNILVIRGTKKEEALAENTQVYLREIFNGDFSRSVEFPFRIDADKVTASYKNGVLGILVPRAEEDKPKKISIKIANQ